MKQFRCNSTGLNQGGGGLRIAMLAAARNSSARTKAGEQNDVHVEKLLAGIYFSGQGVANNNAEGVYWTWPDEKKEPAFSPFRTEKPRKTGRVFRIFNRRMQKQTTAGQPTLKGRLNHPLTSRVEALKQLQATMPLSPSAQAVLRQNKGGSSNGPARMGN